MEDYNNTGVIMKKYKVVLEYGTIEVYNTYRVYRRVFTWWMFLFFLLWVHNLECWDSVGSFATLDEAKNWIKALKGTELKEKEEAKAKKEHEKKFKIKVVWKE